MITRKMKIMILKIQKQKRKVRKEKMNQQGRQENIREGRA